MKIVLAYSGGLDTSVIVKWLRETYDAEIVTFAADIGQEEELKGLPQFRKVIPFTAYAEGWALYCEWLAKQAGWYEKDPFGDLESVEGGHSPVQQHQAIGRAVVPGLEQIQEAVLASFRFRAASPFRLPSVREASTAAIASSDNSRSTACR